MSRERFLHEAAVEFDRSAETPDPTLHEFVRHCERVTRGRTREKGFGTFFLNVVSEDN